MPLLLSPETHAGTMKMNQNSQKCLVTHLEKEGPFPPPKFTTEPKWLTGKKPDVCRLVHPWFLVLLPTLPPYLMPSVP